jgi:hemin uptake protein HemP
MNNTGSSSNSRTGRHSTSTGRDPKPDPEIPRIDSGVLLGASGRVVIEHHGQRYELRETRYGKLILTK